MLHRLEADARCGHELGFGTSNRTSSRICEDLKEGHRAELLALDRALTTDSTAGAKRSAVCSRTGHFKGNRCTRRRPGDGPRRVHARVRGARSSVAEGFCSGSGAGAVMCPRGSSSSSAESRAWVACQYFGASSRQRSRGQYGTMRTISEKYGAGFEVVQLAGGDEREGCCRRRRRGRRSRRTSIPPADATARSSRSASCCPCGAGSAVRRARGKSSSFRS